MLQNVLGDPVQEKEVYLKQIATGIFHVIDQTTKSEEAESLSKIAAELKPLLDNSSINPDLGLELLEFADLKDDSLSNPENSLEQAIAISRAALIKILEL